ncbi:MAG: MotA/TolQ/ExbB proton channel family protein [Opitutales bacterium]
MDFIEHNFTLQGGPVMYPLLIVSVLGFVIFIERTLFLHKGRIGTEDFLGGIKNLVRKKRLVEALALCEDTPGPLARIVKSALLNYGESKECIRSAIQGAAIVEIPLLERRVGALATLARVAPMLGFLGTLIAALQALYFLEAANADSGEFSRLLAEALITSATGLAIAVMAVLAHHFLHGRVRVLVHDFEWVGHEIYAFLTTDPELDAEVSERPKGENA